MSYPKKPQQKLTIRKIYSDFDLYCWKCKKDIKGAIFHIDELESGIYKPPDTIEYEYRDSNQMWLCKSCMEKLELLEIDKYFDKFPEIPLVFNGISIEKRIKNLRKSRKFFSELNYIKTKIIGYTNQNFFSIDTLKFNMKKSLQQAAIEFCEAEYQFNPFYLAILVGLEKDISKERIKCPENYGQIIFDYKDTCLELFERLQYLFDSFSKFINDFCPEKDIDFYKERLAEKTKSTIRNFLRNKIDEHNSKFDNY